MKLLNRIQELLGLARPHEALDRDAFRARVGERLASKGVRLPESEAFAIIDPKGRRLQLENVYRSYIGQPSEAKFEKMLDLLLGTISEIESGPAARRLSKEEILPRILPIIRTLDVQTIVGEPIQRLNEKLGVFLALDNESSMAYLDAATIREAGLGQGAAYAQALDNLRKRTGPKVGRMKDVNVFIGSWGDDYDSSRILLREMFGFFPELKKVRAAIPARGCLLFWDANDEKAEAAALPLVKTLFQHEPGPLSPDPIDL
jgi:uncharacterized protein YtpQ (UPF0354 family)